MPNALALNVFADAMAGSREQFLYGKKDSRIDMEDAMQQTMFKKITQ